MEEMEVFIPATAVPEWLAGRNAEECGQDMIKCPYPPGSSKGRLWREGWMASSRRAPHRHPELSRARGPLPPPWQPAALSPLAQAARASRLSSACPVCEAAKATDAVFCVRCRDALPRGTWHQHPPLSDDAEAYALWWQEACEDLRGE